MSYKKLKSNSPLTYRDLPTGHWEVWMILGHPGPHEVRTGSMGVRTWVMEENCKSIALVGKTKELVIDTMIKGENGLLAMHPENERPTFHPSLEEVHWANGARAYIISAAAYERLRGRGFEGAWVHGLSHFPYLQDTWDQLMFSMREGKNPQVILTTLSPPEDFIKNLPKSPLTLVSLTKNYKNLEAFLIHFPVDVTVSERRPPHYAMHVVYEG